ncbi:MAG TPA: VWA domain-containing protein [Steroidobacteraceae bacterium]|nr:VWA domain-containing protein [Steroidobacteraceae bacterium]
MNPDQRVLLADIQRPIALFAQGLVGHFVHLRPTSRNAPESRSSDGMGTAGDGIELPAQIAEFDTRVHNLGAYRVTVLRQIGYLTDGPAHFSLARAAERLAIPFAVSAAPKLSELEAFLALGSRPVLLRTVFLTLESRRIDGLIAQRYPGAGGDLARLRARALATRPQTRAGNALTGVVEALVRYTLGGERAGLADVLLALADAAIAPGADVYATASAAVAFCRALDPRFRLRAPLSGAIGTQSLEPDAQAAEYLPAPEDLASLGIDFPGEMILQTLNARRRRGGQIAGPQSPSSPVLTSGMPDTATRDLKAADVGARAAASSTQSRESARSYHYDEWDYHAQQYLRAWCRLYEQRLRGERFDFIDDVHRRHALLARQVRRQFGFIRPEQWHRVRRTNDGDELELDGVIEAVIDRRLAGASDSQLYIRRDRALRDVAAAFLMDMSASTGFPLPEASTPAAATHAPAAQYAPYFYGGLDDVAVSKPPPKRRVIDVARDALALMCEALQRLGDSCAIYGFSGDGREQVEFLVAKDFRDRLSAQTWAALAAMEPLRSTRMGPAIRHALMKLLREPARMKVLIIVSDGYPQDHDYGPDRRDDSYGIEDTACALREAERAGVIAFCVTIDPAGHDYLRRMCADSRYMVIDDVMALPRELTKIYRTLTA